MRVPTAFWSRRTCAAMAAGSMVAVLSGCSVGAGAGGAGDSVPAGASKQQYIDALADIDPIELTIQSNQGPGEGQSVAVERYAEAVEDWSGGKITFDIIYSGAVAPIQEAGRAMADGLLDMGFHSYSSSRDSYPVSELVQSTFFLQETTPLAGSLELVAAAVEQTSDVEELRTELENEGLHPMLPLMPTLSSTLFCKGEPVTSLDDAQGLKVAPSGSRDAQEYKAMGFTVVDIPYAEIFDAMQRGVTDCQGAPEPTLLLSGLLEVGDHWTFSPTTAMSAIPTGFDISQATWEQLPLSAQQLLWDRLDVVIAAYTNEFSANIPARTLTEAQRQGVQLHEYGPEMVAALQSHQDTVLETVSQESVNGASGADIVDNARRFHEKWRGIINELGYVPDVPRAEFPAWLKANPVDTQDFAERLVQETLANQRPGTEGNE